MMFAHRSRSRFSVISSTLAVIVTFIVCASSSSPFSSTVIVPVDAQNVCDSTFHKTRLVTTVTNPPLGFTDLLTVVEPASHFQLECLYINQIGPAIRACASPPNQRLQLCYQPLTSNPSTTTDWTCVDISQYLNTQFSTVVIGSSSGPELRIKIQWTSQLTNTECYPRTFDMLMVGLPVPEPGTEIGATIAFVVLVGLVASGAVAYGFYALWRVSKKFEHRDEPNGDSSMMITTTPGGGNNKSREQYRAALAALGAPEDMINNQKGGLYDEEEDDDRGGGEVGNSKTAASKNQKNHEGGDDERDYDDEEMDDQYDDDDDNDSVHQQLNFSGHEANSVSGVHNNNNNFIVLDNNQVIHSEAKPVPWFEKMKQRNNNNLNGDDGLVDSPSNRSQFASPQSTTTANRRPPQSSSAQRRQQQQRVVYENDNDNNNNNQTGNSANRPPTKKMMIPPPPPRPGQPRPSSSSVSSIPPPPRTRY